MKRPQFLISGFVLFVAALVACGRGQPEPPVRRAAVPGLDHTLTVGDVDLIVLDGRLRDNFQVSYIMHYPQANYRFLELRVMVRGAEDPLTWGEEQLMLVIRDKQQSLYYRRPAPSEAGRDQYLFYYQVSTGVDLDEAYLQTTTGYRVDLGLLVPESSETLAASPGPDLGTVGGGIDNSAAGRHAIVAGGSENSASAAHAVVAGGAENSANVQFATIGGGQANSASGTRATVSGGHRNSAIQLDATVSGGVRNTAGGTHATVGGGSHNEAGGRDATVGGGSSNSAGGTHTTVAGGTGNDASGFGSTVGGGAGNLASENHATVAGGLGNEAAGVHATVGGGTGNRATGAYATVPGGLLNVAAAPHSLAAGQRARVAVEHTGAILFADSSAESFHSMAANEFAVRATGGLRFVTGLDEHGSAASGVILHSGSGAWSSLSSRAAKAGVRPVDPTAVLAFVTQLPISTWHYRGQDASVQHMGPMAEDLAVFGLGEDDRTISSIDADGVSLAAIQGLHAKLVEQEGRLAEQNDRIEALQAQLLRVESKDPIGEWSWLGILTIGTVLGTCLCNLLISIKGDTVGIWRMMLVWKRDRAT